MAANAQDLWGQLEVEQIKERLPVDILREQAQLLETKTRGVVRGRVSSLLQREAVLLSFYLEVPTLDDYRYLLFEVLHAVKEPYPISKSTNVGFAPFATKESEFVAWLGQQLSSPETHRTIRGLMAHAGALAS